MNPLLITIEGIQEVLAVCPCCGDVFRLVDSKFIFPQRPTKSSEYLDLVRSEQRASFTENQLSKAQENFDAKLEKQREALRNKGEKRAKRKLKKIDPVFSGRDIDPDDVKVIFNPIEYVIFHGMSQKNIRRLEFVSRQPKSATNERTVASIDDALSKRNVTFETLRLRDDGTFSIEPG